jgi:histidine triad (HIT) family protein
MASIFTRIADGEIPSRMIWRDDRCFAMLDIRPLGEGHVLVIPLVEIDQWTDLHEDVAAHLFTVAHRISIAQRDALSPARVALIVAGFEVPHTHLHVIPANSMSNLDFSTADTEPDQAGLDTLADTLRAQLRNLGYGEFVVDG